VWTSIVLYDAGKILFNATVIAHGIDFFSIQHCACHAATGKCSK